MQFRPRHLHLLDYGVHVHRRPRCLFIHEKCRARTVPRRCAGSCSPFGITVNCIAPGPIDTDLPNQVLTADQWKTMAARTALGRWGTPREVAGPALLLASDAGSYITGSVLLVDGGMLARAF